MVRKQNLKAGLPSKGTNPRMGQIFESGKQAFAKNTGKASTPESTFTFRDKPEKPTKPKKK